MQETIETRNTSCKNKISKAIRTALSTPSQDPIPDISKSTSLFDEIPDELSEFVSQFEEAGGKCIIFTLNRNRMRANDKQYISNKLSEIYGYVQTEIDQGGFQTVLNASPKLADVLQTFHIPFVDSIPADSPVDAAIVYAEYLIPRTGSLVFSQRSNLLLYPSVRNLAKNLIVLAGCVFAHDLKDLFVQLSQPSQSEERPTEDVELQFDMMEILRPTRVVEGNYTVANPHVTLVLLVEQ